MTDKAPAYDGIRWFAILAVLIGLTQIIQADWLGVLIWVGFGGGMWLTRDLDLTQSRPFRSPAQFLGLVLALIAVAAMVVQIAIDVMAKLA